MEAEAIGSPRSRGHCTKKWQQREAGTGRPDRPLWPDLGAGKKSFGLWPAEEARPTAARPPLSIFATSSNKLKIPPRSIAPHTIWMHSAQIVGAEV